MDFKEYTEIGDDNKSHPEISKSSYENSVIEMSIDCWRLQKLFLKIARQLDAGEQTKYESQLRYFQNNSNDILERFGLKLINLEGQLYDGGMAVVALNISEFTPADKLVVDQMTEPVIMSNEGLKKMGTVLLRRII